MTAPDVNATVPQLWPRTVLLVERPGQRSRWIIKPTADDADHCVVGEWELTAAGVEDLHPVDEINHVLTGELFVESAGNTVIARAGDTVRVAGGTPGRYWAPYYARMLAVHDPNRTNAPTEVIAEWTLPATDCSPARQPLDEE